MSGSSLSVRSTKARRSDLVKLKTFFFQPRELRGEFADFGVEVSELLLVSSLGGVKGLLLVDEQVGQSSDGGRLPLGELSRDGR